jgi:hypothetical protein
MPDLTAVARLRQMPLSTSWPGCDGDADRARPGANGPPGRPQEVAMRPSRRPLRLLVALAVLATVLLASAAPGDWWQFGYTAAHTRFNPNETTITQANVATLGIAAQHRPRLGLDTGPHDAADAGALAVANGFAYASAWNYEGGTSAYEGGTSAPRTPATSRRPTAPSTSACMRTPPTAVTTRCCHSMLVRVRFGGGWPASSATPAVAGGLVFAGLAQGIGAWRLSDGVRRWRYGSAAYGAPMVSGGRLYVSATTLVDGQPVALHDQFALGAAAPGVIG